MIDTNYLNSFQRDFTTEVNEIKYIISLQNELKLNFQSLKNIIEAESKTIETFSKSLSYQVFSFLNDSSSVNDDPTNCLKFSNVFISVFNNFSTNLGDENANLNTSMIKLNKEISEDYNNSTKNIQEFSSSIFKDLINFKTKYRSQITKAEKNMKEIENSITYRRKIDSDKNPSGKAKTDEKIVSLLNELEENKGHLLIIFDNIKRDEYALNELITVLFQNSVKYIAENINKLKNYSSTMVKQKMEINNKIKESLIQGLETLNLIEIDFSEHYEKKFSDLKNIKYDDIESINIEDPSQKFNFTSIHESISNYMNCFTMCVSIRKKILNFLFKFFNEILKHSENFITNYQKLTKSIYITPKTSVCNFQFLLQLFDFLRSFFELNIKKTEEWNKSISNNPVLLTDVVSRELNTEENNLLNVWYKLSKDLIGFKEKNSKYLSQKEKILSNIQQVKGDILKTSDDPNNFSKYEAKLHNLRLDESNMNDTINDNQKKYKKYLDENFESFKSNIREFKAKEAKKFKEIKESLNNVIKSMERVFFQINDFLSVGTQIFFQNDTKDDLKNIYTKLIKDYHIDETHFDFNFEESENLLYKPLLLKKNFKLAEEDIKAKIIFLNKDINIIIKDLRPSFLKEDEISDLKDKLSTNKPNVRPLQIEASLLNFSSENVIDSFHCAYLEKNVYYGRLIVTSQKLYLHYFLGPLSINSSVIEIPLGDVLAVDKKVNIVYDNSILIKTKSQEYFITDLIFRDKCYRNIIKLLVENGILDEKLKPSSNINSETHSVHENANNQNNFQYDIEDNGISSPFNEKFTDKSVKPMNLTNSLANSVSEQENIEMINNEINFFERLKDINTQRFDLIKIRPNFQNVIIKDEILGDIPLFIVFKHLYDYRVNCNEFDKGKNFLTSLLEIRNDSNIKFINDEINKENIPLYLISEEYNYDLLYSKIKSESLNRFIDDVKNWIIVPYEFHYKYTHPCKKVFMGPDKLEVDDHFKIYFISPTCLIVETFTYLSGFMLMDTFFTVAQIKFESDIYFDDKLKRLAFNTKVSVSHSIEFTKPNLFKSKVESEAIKEYTQLINEMIIPSFKKVLNNESKLFYETLCNAQKPDSNQIKIENCNFVIYQNSDKNLYSIMYDLMNKIDKLEKRLIQLEANK